MGLLSKTGVTGLSYQTIGEAVSEDIQKTREMIERGKDYLREIKGEETELEHKLEAETEDIERMKENLKASNIRRVMNDTEELQEEEEMVLEQMMELEELERKQLEALLEALQNMEQGHGNIHEGIERLEEIYATAMSIDSWEKHREKVRNAESPENMPRSVKKVENIDYETVQEMVSGIKEVGQLFEQEIAFLEELVELIETVISEETKTVVERREARSLLEKITGRPLHVFREDPKITEAKDRKEVKRALERYKRHAREYESIEEEEYKQVKAGMEDLLQLSENAARESKSMIDKLNEDFEDYWEVSAGFSGWMWEHLDREKNLKKSDYDEIEKFIYGTGSPRDQIEALQQKNQEIFEGINRLERKVSELE